MTQVTLDSLSAEEALQMGMAAHNAAQFAIAERLYRHAIARQPGMAAALHHLGLILRGSGRSAEAIKVLTAALVIDPDLSASRHALGTTLLNIGDYRAGWPLFETRLTNNPQVPKLDKPVWMGGPLAKRRLAIFAEQGMGDMIQFARFAPRLAERGAEIVLLCQPSLVSLFAHSFPSVEVLPAVGTVDLGELDYWIMAMSIPDRMCLTTDSVPRAPYLKARNPQPTSLGRLRVGLAAQGNPKQENDARRSLNAEQTARLRAMSGVEIVSLHPEDSGARDFLETADIVAGLDLVVSVDSSVGHLAGAMGKRTLLLIPGFAGDWRWIRGRNDSPWYPHHRLFRSTVGGDWSEALAGVEKAVEQLRAAKAAQT